LGRQGIFQCADGVGFEKTPKSCSHQALIDVLDHNAAILAQLTAFDF